MLGHILDIAPLTAERVTTILAVMDGITADFVALFGAHSSECAGLADFYGELKARILGELERAPPGSRCRPN